MSTSVLIIGASGYIGEGVAIAYRRAGYKVYGVIRNEKKRIELLKNEIIPVVADQSDFEKLKPYIAKCQIIIDAVGFQLKTSQQFFEFVVSTISTNTEVHIDNYKPLFIFTSGIMTFAHKEHDRIILDENLADNTTEMKDRKQFEDIVLSNKTLRAVVIRPGFVYGKIGGFVPEQLHFFDVDKHKDLELLEYLKGFRWSWVHVDDLGEAYVRVAKVGNIVNGQLFNIVANDNPTYEELKIAAAKAAGWKGEIKWIQAEKIEFPKWAHNVIINPAKAFELLGWRPRHIGVVHEMEMYYTTWKLARIEGEALLEEIKAKNENQSHGAYFGVFM